MSTLDQISETQSGKATAANDNFQALAVAGLGGRKASGCTGATFAYYGGLWLAPGSPSYYMNVPDGTIALSEGQNHIEMTTGGVVQKSANSPSGFNPGKIPLAVVTYSAGTQSYEDRRVIALQVHP